MKLCSSDSTLSVESRDNESNIPKSLWLYTQRSMALADANMQELVLITYYEFYNVTGRFWMKISPEETKVERAWKYLLAAFTGYGQPGGNPQN